ncbi:MAG: flippase-like domain-containing protein [Bryobacterales bacterium]|nr:flippase-like domain-containing protein [Bryobacterales bacterium]
MSLGCMVWVYKGFDWQRELPRILAIDVRWVTVAVIADILVYCCQGWRWSLLLSPLARVPAWRSIQAVYIGLFANEILPLRTGEVIRSYLQSKWAGLPFSVVISSAVIERLFDGIWLILGFYTITYFVTLPALLVEGGRLLAVVLFTFTLLLGVAVFTKHRAHAAFAQSRWKEKLWHVIEGLHNMGNSQSFYASFALSFVYLALQVVPVYALIKGYGLDLSIGAAVVVLVILRIGSIPPQAPGNVGSFQALTKLGLMLLGVQSDVATGFATVLFFAVTVPLWLGGFVALALTGMKLSDLHRDAHTRPGTVQVEPQP